MTANQRLSDWPLTLVKPIKVVDSPLARPKTNGHSFPEFSIQGTRIESPEVIKILSLYIPFKDDNDDCVDGNTGKTRATPMKADKTGQNCSPASSKSSLKEDLAPRTGKASSPCSSGRESQPTEKQLA
jgi:hypothetical protein